MPPEPSEEVVPAKPIVPWQGGKRFLAPRIVEQIEAVPHRCYAEPFVGSGTVFLRRAKRAPVEIINDINGEIVNLFRVVRAHPTELDRQFEWALAAREEFLRLLAVPPESLTDIQRAARFVVIQRLRFSGKTESRSTKFSPHRKISFHVSLISRLIRGAHARLQDVQIERLDWAEFIRRYDRPFTLFYLDPPYWGHEDDYGKGIFARDDFARMADILRGLAGRFILSLNDRPEVRETFAGFRFEQVSASHTINAKAARQVGELLISGGDSPA